MAHAAAAAGAANAARDLQNCPANEMTPSALADRARSLAGVQVEVWGREQIVAAGMGAMAAVAQGSDQEPQLITIRYEPADVAGPVLGFVGKGVTFDSGGISIKPPLKMSEMKFDMSGAAAVLEATGAIAALGLPVRLVSVLGATENLLNGRVDEARRHPAREDRHDDRGAQHRRRGPARPRRLPRARDRPAAPSASSTSPR